MYGIQYNIIKEKMGLKMFRKFLLHFTGVYFCKIFNIKNLIMQKKIRFSFDSRLKRYIAKENARKLYFIHRKQALYAYNVGIENRIKNLSNRYMLEILKFNNGDIVVDVGANIGDLYQCFTKIGIDINYIAFEPSTPEYLCLKKNTSGELHNKALWKSKKKIDFFSAPETADSSLIKPEGYDKVYTIKAYTLNSLLAKKKIKLLKVEGEGAEPEILLGAKKILNNIEYITADLGYERGTKKSSTIEVVTNFLLKNNFNLIKFNRENMTALFQNVHKKIN